MAQVVQGVLQAPLRCFLEYQGFQGCPVAPVGLEDQGVQGGLAQVFSSLEKDNRLKEKSGSKCQFENMCSM